MSQTIKKENLLSQLSNNELEIVYLFLQGEFNVRYGQLQYGNMGLKKKDKYAKEIKILQKQFQNITLEQNKRKQKKNKRKTKKLYKRL